MKYINFTLQANKFKEDNPKESDYNGYFKDPLTDEKIFFVKVWKHTGKFGEYLSGSIHVAKAKELIETYEDNEDFKITIQ